MKRRTFVSSLATAGIAATTAGCTGGDEGPPRDPVTENSSRRTKPMVEGSDRPPRRASDEAVNGPLPAYAREFGTVVDVTEVGADPSGQESIAPIIEERLGDDTLLYLPRGTYLLDRTIEIFEFEKFGIVGDRATIVPPEGYTRVLFDVGRPGRANDFIMEGITFDIRAPNTGPRPLSVLSAGNVVVRNVSVIGEQDDGWGMIRFDVTDEDSVGVVDRLRLPGGSAAEVSSAGCLVGEYHRGEAIFVDCHIDGFSDNGLYASPENGTVRVEGGYFANCKVSSLRVGDGATVRGAHVRCDTAPEGFGNMRGIRLTHGRDLLVENCTVEMLDVVGSDGGIVMADSLESATVKDTTIRVDADDIIALRIKPPAEDIVDRAAPIRCENVSITGSAARRSAVRVVDRQGAEFDNISIRQSGSARDGFHFIRSTDATVRDAYIDVTGTPILLDESDVRRRRVEIA